ncbi:MAG: response regulator transcription factor [Anaerolineae bacterium]
MSTDVIVLGPIRVDRVSATVSVEGVPIHLTPKEALLLWTLMRQPNVVLTRAVLMQRVWDTTFTGDTRTLEVHINWLRKKIERDPRRPIYLRTVRRQGYVFAWPPSGTTV